MKVHILSLTVALAILSALVLLPTSAYPKTDEHKDWIAKSLREIESVKVGMTRGELLKVFNEEGGPFTRRQQRYVYHECPYIKVNVEFEAASQVEDQIVGSAEDKITKISKPFLEWSVND